MLTSLSRIQASRHVSTVALLSLLWLAQPDGAVAASAQPEVNLRIGGSGTDLATFRIIADEFEKRNPGYKVEIPPSLGSGGAVRAVRAGWLNIGLISRPLKRTEESPDINTILYAKTPLVFAVSSKHPVNTLTLEQVAAIYSGERIRWDNGSDIRLVLRPKSDSDSLLLLATYPQLTNALNKAWGRRGIPLSVTDQEAAEKLQNLPGAFGTTTLTLILSETSAIKALLLHGIEPSVKNITNGQYALHKELYLILPIHLPPKTAKFIEFIHSTESIEILQRTGHQVFEFTLSR